jgi:hypothetical protein
MPFNTADRPPERRRGRVMSFNQGGRFSWPREDFTLGEGWPFPGT